VPDNERDLGVNRVDRPRAGDVAGNLYAHRASRERVTTTLKYVTSLQ
jgi:hypothetical protein